MLASTDLVMRSVLLLSQLIRSSIAVLAMFVCGVIAVSQTQSTPEKPVEKDAKPAGVKPVPKLPFTLTVKTKPILNISLKAEKVSMAEVAQELSKRLKTPVFVGPERQKEHISVDFSELTLEPALQLLAPTVYVDYEIDTGSHEQPRALGIFLFDTDQGEPPVSAVVRGSTQAMLIEGDTEDGTDEETDEKKLEEKPLRVTYQNYQLSVKAKKQALPLILMTIGETIGIPVELQDDRMDLVDADISKLSVEEALRQLSPNIKLFVRADLTRAERRPLRLVLAQAPKTTQ